MLLQPKRTKYRKAHKGRIHGLAHKASELTFGQYGLKAMSAGRVTGRQIEAARRAMTRHIKRGGRIWIRMFPNVPVSGKPAEVRQGKGKGNVEYWIARVKPGRILYEMEDVFKNEFYETASHQFRHINDISIPAFLYFYYASGTGRAIPSSLKYMYLDKKMNRFIRKMVMSLFVKKYQSF